MKGGLSPLRVTLSAQYGTLALSSSLETTMARARAYAKPRKRSIYREDQSFSRFRTTRGTRLHVIPLPRTLIDSIGGGGGSVGRGGKEKAGGKGEGERDRAVDGRRVRA